MASSCSSFLSDPPEIHHVAGTVLAQDLLYASNGVAIVIKQETNATQKSDVFRPVVTPAASPLHRLQLSEFGLPEAKHVLRDLKLVSNLADGAKRLGRLVQRSTSSASRCRSTTLPPFCARAHR